LFDELIVEQELHLPTNYFKHCLQTSFVESFHRVNMSSDNDTIIALMAIHIYSKKKKKREQAQKGSTVCG